MIKSRYEIEMKGGVKVEMIFTLALYGIAKKRKISLDLPADAGLDDRITYFVRLMYCAAILAWEYRSIDNPQLGDFPYQFIDFAEWAANNPAQFAILINGASAAITGKDPEECEEPEDVKKKK